jgi:hypothetical protein
VSILIPFNQCHFISMLANIQMSTNSRVTYLCLGDVVYSGNTRQMLDYFRNIGFPCPEVNLRFSSGVGLVGA